MINFKGHRNFSDDRVQQNCLIRKKDRYGTGTNFSNSTDSFSINASLPYPLKTSENLRFSAVFRGYRRETLVENELDFLLNFKKFSPKQNNLL